MAGNKLLMFAERERDELQKKLDKVNKVINILLETEMVPENKSKESPKKGKRGKKATEETKQKLRDSWQKRKNSKKVEQANQEMEDKFREHLEGSANAENPHRDE